MVVVNRFNLSEFIPVSGPLKTTEAALKEYYGLAAYRLIIFLRKPVY